MKPKAFHRSDFTGSEGPGLAKLRAAKPAPETTKAKRKGSLGLESLRELMRAGKWQDAILAAAKYPELGDQAAAIHRGREAIMRPAFQRQLKRDPALMVEEAKAALRERFKNA